MPMPNPFDQVLEALWLEAKVALRAIDPQFVRAVEAIKAVQEHTPGFDVSAIPAPSARLSKRWTDVLESGTHVALQVDVLDMTLEQAAPERLNGMVNAEARRIGHHLLNTWLHNAYALGENVSVLITRVCDLYPTDTREGYTVRQLEESFRTRIKEYIAQHVSPVRIPVVHGVGGNGLFARGITEDRLWEGGVALGIFPSAIVDFFYSAHSDFHNNLQANLSRMNNQLVTDLASLLEEFQGERSAVAPAPPP